MEDKFLTHENGAPVNDNTNSLTAGNTVLSYWKMYGSSKSWHISTAK